MQSNRNGWEQTTASKTSNHSPEPETLSSDDLEYSDESDDSEYEHYAWQPSPCNIL